MNKVDISKKSEGEVVDLICYVKTYEERKTKNGSGVFLTGSLEAMGSIDFKVWAGSLFNEMSSHDYKDRVCSITAKVNLFGGATSLILMSCKALEEGTYKVEDFFESRYNAEDYTNGLYKIVSKYCGEEMLKVYDDIMETVADRFSVEFAARSHHDATKSGLLAHTYKVTYMVARTAVLYPNLIKKCSMELLILGAALHDIGKVYEYHNGTITDVGKLISHPQLGIEILYPFKDAIIRASSIDFYYRLIGIVSAHHGEWGEPARNIEAMIIHYADNMESKMQVIDESLGLSADSTIFLGDYKLN